MVIHRLDDALFIRAACAGARCPSCPSYPIGTVSLIPTRAWMSLCRVSSICVISMVADAYPQDVPCQATISICAPTYRMFPLCVITVKLC